MTNLAFSPALSADHPQKRRQLLRFIALSVVWGGSFLFMKWALTGMTFYSVALGRNIFGALTLVILAVMLKRRLQIPTPMLPHIVVSALLMMVIPALLFAWAGTQISSGLSSIYNATTPIMTVVVSWAAFRGTHLSARALLAVGIGFLGVIIVAEPWSQASTSGGAGEGLWGHAACLAATFCYGLAYVYIRKHLGNPSADPLVIAAWQVSAAALILAPAAPFMDWNGLHIDFVSTSGIVLLGALSTGLAYAWNNDLIQAWGPSRAAQTTYATPVIGVLLGIFLLQESLSWIQPLGMLLVLLGVVLSYRDSPAAAAPQVTHSTC